MLFINKEGDSLPLAYEENKVSFSLAGKGEPSGRERILCKGNKKIDYIFPVDLKHVVLLCKYASNLRCSY